MVKASCLALLVTLSVAAPEVRAQSAQSILDRHIAALGGAKAVRAATSLRLSGTVAGGGEFLWLTKAPNAYSLEVRRGEAREVEAFGGNSPWREDASGLHTLTGREQARARAEGAYRNDHFLNWKKEKVRVRLLGRETVEGRPAYAVELTTSRGIGRRVFFDAQTYMILKE